MKTAVKNQHCHQLSCAKKGSLALAMLGMIVMLGACAKERTTPYQDPRTQTIQGQTASNEKPVKKDVEPAASPASSPSLVSTVNPAVEENLLEKSAEFEVMNSVSDGDRVKELYESLNASEVAVPKPEGVICEYIPQTRLKKSLGRLECTKQFPQNSTSSEHVNYACHVNLSADEYITIYDQHLYNQLNVEEKTTSIGIGGDTTFTKQVGRFHCDKTLIDATQEAEYSCEIERIVK